MKNFLLKYTFVLMNVGLHGIGFIIPLVEQRIKLPKEAFPAGKKSVPERNYFMVMMNDLHLEAQLKTHIRELEKALEEERNEALLRITGLETELHGLKLEIARSEYRADDDFYRKVVEHSADVIWLMNLQGRFTYISPSVYVLRGFRPAEVLLQDLEDALAPASYLLFSRAIDHIQATEQTGIKQNDYPRLELEQICNDGSTVWTEVICSAMRDHNQKLSGILCVCRNISEQKAASTKLRESEVQYRNLANAGSALIWRSGTDKLCYYFNEPWLAFTGRSLEQEAGNGWINGVHPDDLNHCLAVYNSSFKTQDSFEMEYRLRHHSGEYRWIQDIGKPNYDSNGQFVGYIGHCFDISAMKKTHQELRDYALRLEEAEKIAGLGSWEYNTQSHTGWWSKQMFVHLNFDFSESVPDLEDYLEHIHPDDRNIIAEVMTKMASGEIPECMRVRTNPAYGQLRFLMPSVFTETEKNGAIIRYIGTMLDITDPLRKEALLRESEDNYRRLFESMTDCYVRVDMKGNLVEANQSYCQLLGYTPEELYTKNYRDLTPETWEAFESEIVQKQVFATGSSKVYEKEYFHCDGHIFPVELRTYLLQDNNGKPAGMWAIVRDISSRKKSEVEMKELNLLLEEKINQRTAELSDLYNNAPCGYHSVDHESCFIHVNDTELEWLGYKRDELIGKMKFAELLTPDSLKRFSENFEQFKNSGKFNEVEFELICRDGSILPVLLSATAEFDENNRFLFSRSTITDNRQRKAAEKILFEYQQQLETVNKDLEAFAYSISHDLRAPLRHIEGFTGLLKNAISEPDNNVLQYLNIIKSSTVNMSKMIDDLLSFSRLGRKSLVKTEVSLNQLVEKSLSGFMPEQENRNIEWKIESLPLVYCDPNLMQMVIDNLISNAIKFTSKKEKAIIEIASVPGETAAFYIRDNGVGFDMQYAGKLFGVFQRLHIADEFEGTGIGLANIKQIIQKHNGSISVSAAPDMGATFTIRLKPGRQD